MYKNITCTEPPPTPHPTGLKLILTRCNDGRHGSALHIILHSHNTDVVLNAWNEVVQRAGVLTGLHKLLHAVSFLPISWSACYFVTSDIWEEDSPRSDNVNEAKLYSKRGSAEVLQYWVLFLLTAINNIANFKIYFMQMMHLCFFNANCAIERNQNP